MKVNVWRETKWECPKCGEINEIDAYYMDEIKDRHERCTTCEEITHITGEK